MSSPEQPEWARHFALESVPNFRDIGGYGAHGGGVVRTGAVFRSTDLSRLSDEDSAALARLDIRTVYDLRSVAERDRAPDRLPPGSSALALDVLRDRGGSAITAQMLRVIEDPMIAETELGGGRAARYFESSYRDFVTMPSAVAAYRTMFAGLVGDEEGEPLPALVHCTTGKDRTGWATAALHLLLGVSEEHVFDDYLSTNGYLLPALSVVFETFESQGGDPSLLEPVLGVQRSYLESALAVMEENFGAVENYFAEGLGIDDKAQAQLRELLITDAQ
ncbi:tyrosine-protein phosphatase [Rhodococcus sp. NPDC058521]|uniref:tyrosine-protein phosphatase n=1 Tax=Rhodococcus sp. NPDC058521 TaxID=3346536 RepID=UPI003659F7F4